MPRITSPPLQSLALAVQGHWRLRSMPRHAEAGGFRTQGAPGQAQFGAVPAFAVVGAGGWFSVACSPRVTLDCGSLRSRHTDSRTVVLRLLVHRMMRGRSAGAVDLLAIQRSPHRVRPFRRASRLHIGHQGTGRLVEAGSARGRRRPGWSRRGGRGRPCRICNRS